MPLQFQPPVAQSSESSSSSLLALPLDNSNARAEEKFLNIPTVVDVEEKEEQDEEDELEGLENATMALTTEDESEEDEEILSDEGEEVEEEEDVTTEGSDYEEDRNQEMDEYVEDGKISKIGNETEPHRTYVVIVNDDGTLMLNPPGIPTSGYNNDGGQTVIPVRLPVSKVQNLDQPLVGAIQIDADPKNYRIRRPRPQGVLYNREEDKPFKILPDHTEEWLTEADSEESASEEYSQARLQAARVGSQTLPIDINEFTAQLEPLDLANLENVLQSEQAREILENLALENAEGAPDPGVALWDHSYSVQPGNVGSSYIISGHSGEGRSGVRPPATPSGPGTITTRRRSSRETPRQLTESLTTTSSSETSSSPSFTLSSDNSSSKGLSRTTPRLTISEGSGPRSGSSHSSDSSTNIRRSQRQQDRMERAEIERILAENQEMLQKEKEIMKAQSPVPISAAPSTVSSAHATPVGRTLAVSPDITFLTTPRVSSVSAIIQKQLFPQEGPKGGTSPTRAYPKRENRKVPAYLADPNYVSLDEEHMDTKMEDEQIELEDMFEAKPKIEEIDVKAGLEDEEEGICKSAIKEEGAEEVDVEDPYKLWCICRQPHNNRFMICCDRCEEWFHGKCVGVTRAQGKAIEETNSIWHCPPCKRTLRAEAQARRQKIPPRRRSSETIKSKIPAPITHRPAAVIETRRRSATSESAEPPGQVLKRQDSLPLTQKLKQTELPASWKTENTKTISKSGKQLKTVTAAPSRVVNKCIACDKTARPDSVYCSNDCVIKHSRKTRMVQSSVVSQPLTSQLQKSLPPNASKLKRSNSKPDHGGESENFLTFHVITPGSNKSTEVVPAKHKEVSASNVTKASPTAVSITALPLASAAMPIVTQPTVRVRKLSSHSVKNIDPQAVSSGSKIKERDRDAGNAKGSSSLALSSTKSSRPSTLKISDQKSTKSSSSSKHVETPLSRKGSSSSISLLESSSSLSRSNSVSGKSKETQDKDKAVHRKKETPTEKVEKKEVNNEAKLRENMKKSIGEILSNRVKTSQGELSEGYKSPTSVAEKIEEELVQCFGGWSNIKCKNKYRSIFFNLKDPKNALYRDLLNGSLLAKDLVRMEPHQMASAELTEWRIRESEKELEAIKRSEIDKLAEAKKQELIDAGTEFDKVASAEQEARSMNITDVIKAAEDENVKDQVGGTITTPMTALETIITTDKKEKDKDRSSTSHSHGSSSSHGHGKSKKKDKKLDKDRDRHRDRDRDRGKNKDRHRHTSSSTSEKTSDKTKQDKEKVRDRDLKKYDSKDSLKEKEMKKSSSNDKNNAKKDKESKRHDSSLDKEKSKSEVTDHKKELERQLLEENSGSRLETSPVDEISMGSTTEDSSSQNATMSSEVKIRQSMESEQELPSSTIKTPDFMDESHLKSKEAMSPFKSILNTKLIMPELGQFNALVYNVSHNHLDGIFFPESPVPIVGRISPDIVWDYINKMKKNKELIVFRLAPATPADAEAYMSFFTYLSARERFGVLGGIAPPLKDVYLVPLDKHGPINRTLLPFRGPGLPKDRSHVLLAIVTRHEPQAALTKRLSTSSTSESLKKKPKLKPAMEIKAGLIAKLHLGQKDKPGKVGSTAASSVTGPAGPENEDDDTPYTPWEEDDDKNENSIDLTVSPDMTSKSEDKTQAQLMLEELNAKIEKEKQEIESISVALTRSEHSSVIPGLDGEFVDSPIETKEAVIESPLPQTKGIPFFLRMPSLQPKPSTALVADILPNPKPELLILPPIKICELIELEEEPEPMNQQLPYSPSDSDDEPQIIQKPELVASPQRIPGFGNLGDGDVDDRRLNVSDEANFILPDMSPPSLKQFGTPTVMDLDDRILDLEPPPLSRAERPHSIAINIRAQPQSGISLLSSPPPKIHLISMPVLKPPPVFEASKLSSPKGKISISLSTKSLPPQQNFDLPSVGITPPPLPMAAAPKLTPRPPAPAIQPTMPQIPRMNLPVDIINSPPPSLVRIPPPAPISTQTPVNVNIPPPSLMAVINRNIPPPPMMSMAPRPPMLQMVGGMPALTRFQPPPSLPAIPPMPPLRSEGKGQPGSSGRTSNAPASTNIPVPPPSISKAAVTQGGLQKSHSFISETDSGSRLEKHGFRERDKERDRGDWDRERNKERDWDRERDRDRDRGDGRYTSTDVSARFRRESGGNRRHRSRSPQVSRIPARSRSRDWDRGRGLDRRWLPRGRGHGYGRGAQNRRSPVPSSSSFSWRRHGGNRKSRSPEKVSRRPRSRSRSREHSRRWSRISKSRSRSPPNSGRKSSSGAKVSTSRSRSPPNSGRKSATGTKRSTSRSKSPLNSGRRSATGRKRSTSRSRSPPNSGWKSATSRKRSPSRSRSPTSLGCTSASDTNPSISQSKSRTRSHSSPRTSQSHSSKKEWMRDEMPQLDLGSPNLSLKFGADEKIVTSDGDAPISRPYSPPSPWESEDSPEPPPPGAE